MSTFPEGGLQNLILDRKGPRSYERLARDCGGGMKANNLQMRATRNISSFPDPTTMDGLARGLDVTVTRVILACAISLGLPVRPTDGSVLELPGAGLLPKDSQELLLSMSRELQNAHHVWSQKGYGLAAHEGEEGVAYNDTAPHGRVR